MESRPDFIDEEPGSETSEPPEEEASASAEGETGEAPEDPPNEGAQGSGERGGFPEGGPQAPERR